MDEAISLATANGFVEVTGSPISVPNATATIATRGALFWRRYSGQGDPVTNDPGNHIVAQRYAFSGCITSGDPWDFVQTSSEATEDTTGSATGNNTSGADRLIAIVLGSSKPDTLGTTEVSNFVNANLTSLTERADNAGNSGNGGHLGLATGVLAASGASGTTTYDKATSAYKWHFVVALKPPDATTYTMTASQGSYTLTGQSMTPKVSRLLALAQGAFTLTGQAMSPKVSRLLTAAQGAYTLTGQAVTLKWSHVLSAVTGMYSLAGQAMSPKVSRLLALAQGAYALTGQAVTLTRQKVISMATGSFTLTGQSLNLLYHRVLNAVTGSYTLTGFDTIEPVLAADAIQLHALPDDFLLNANGDAPRGAAVGLTFTVYLTDENGNYLTDELGHRLIGDLTEFISPIQLTTLPDDFNLNSEQL
jgi:hypothetical protein